jgi:prevent-host-death family protein
MQQIVGVTELQRQFRRFFDQVVNQRTPIVLTRGSRPEAVLIPYEEYLRFQTLRESEVLARFDQVWARLSALNANVAEEELAADIEAARSEC